MYLIFRADFLACVDACFTHKRLKEQGKSSQRDPQRTHPNSVFISESDVDSMEAFVELCRSHRAEESLGSNTQEDYVEPGMQVPSSVLDDCKHSFVSADEKRRKASIQLFVATALMALLCRHDRVLWLVNMTSAGEKQYYVLALIQCLLNHLSNDVSLSILYDIGCQLPCVTFAISVFHTFGHQWPCQIVYHP